MSLPIYLQAFIYQVKVLKKGNQVIIGCGDYHDKQHASHIGQRASIFAALKACDLQKTSIILEDLCTAAGEKPSFCESFFDNLKGSILGGFTQQCRKLGLSVLNVEFRHCRVASLAPILYNLSADLHSLPTTCSIKIADVMTEVMEALSVVHHYKDGPVLTQWYKKLLKKLYADMEGFAMHASPQATVADYLQSKLYSRDKVAMLSNLLTFDSDLLDAKIIHKIMNTQHTNKIFIFAGGAHINRVSDMLQKVGYQQVYATKVVTYKEQNKKKCVGTEVFNGNFCVRPKALKARALSKALTKF